LKSFIAPEYDIPATRRCFILNPRESRKPVRQYLAPSKRRHGRHPQATVPDYRLIRRRRRHSAPARRRLRRRGPAAPAVNANPLIHKTCKPISETRIFGLASQRPTRAVGRLWRPPLAVRRSSDALACLCSRAERSDSAVFWHPRYASH